MSEDEGLDDQIGLERVVRVWFEVGEEEVEEVEVERLRVGEG